MTLDKSLLNYWVSQGQINFMNKNENNIIHNYTSNKQGEKHNEEC